MVVGKYQPQTSAVNKELAQTCAFEFLDIIYRLYDVPSPYDLVNIDKIINNANRSHGKLEIRVEKAIIKEVMPVAEYYMNEIINQGEPQRSVFDKEFSDLLKKYKENDKFIRDIKGLLVKRSSEIEKKDHIQMGSAEPSIDRYFPKCAFCDHHYLKPQVDRRSLYCSDKCKTAAWTKRRRDGMVKPRLPRCKVCGAPMAKRKGAKTCSTKCRLALHQQKKKA